MKRQDIEARLRAGGIASLNEMQKELADAPDAPATILLAPTGSGKTIAFTVPVLLTLGRPGSGLEAVVIAPSRELVLQIAEVMRRLATGYKTVAFYGGHPMAEEVNSMSVEPDIIVATPGRLLDHINRSTVDVSRVATLVLDEYDKSLELGFEREMKKIVKQMTGIKRVILTSATALAEVPAYIPRMGDARTFDFTDSACRRREPAVWVESPVRDKLDTLVDMLRVRAGEPTLVFVNHRDSADRVYKRLRAEKIPAGLYHGGLDQPTRENALEMFTNGTTPVLVSTDLGARGLDIDGVKAVIHYHLPPTPESWTHRNGRTGRYGADGTVYVITTEGEDIPEWVVLGRRWQPSPSAETPDWGAKASLYFNVGKKEKISRGDIAGFLIAKGGLAPDEVGRISLRDHCAIVAVPADKAGRAIAAASAEKIKGKRARISRLG